MKEKLSDLLRMIPLIRTKYGGFEPLSPFWRDMQRKINFYGESYSDLEIEILTKAIQSELMPKTKQAKAVQPDLFEREVSHG